MNLLFGNSTVCLRQGELMYRTFDFKFTPNPNSAHVIDESQKRIRRCGPGALFTLMQTLMRTPAKYTPPRASQLARPLVHCTQSATMRSPKSPLSR
jgi:hypothetical protein